MFMHDLGVKSIVDGRLGSLIMYMEFSKNLTNDFTSQLTLFSCLSS